jgi:translation initiation factor IF-2
VPIIVAMNKMDRVEADPDRVKGELAQLELIPEDYGGDTIVIPVSAKTGQGVQDLLDMILIVAELQELKSNPKARPAVRLSKRSRTISAARSRPSECTAARCTWATTWLWAMSTAVCAP